MAWVPVASSSVTIAWAPDWGGAQRDVHMSGSYMVVEGGAIDGLIAYFRLSAPRKLRITAVEWLSEGGCPYEYGGSIVCYGDNDEYEAQWNESGIPTAWAPPVMYFEPADTGSDGYTLIGYQPSFGGDCTTEIVESFRFLIEVWEGGGPPAPGCFWAQDTLRFAEQTCPVP